MVLNSQLEVGQRHRDERRHDDEDDKHDEQDAVDCVHLHSPGHSMRAEGNIVAWEGLSVPDETAFLWWHMLSPFINVRVPRSGEAKYRNDGEPALLSPCGLISCCVNRVWSAAQILPPATHRVTVPASQLIGCVVLA